MENFIYYVGFICIWCFVFLLPLILIRIVVFIENIISFFKDLVKIRKEWLENEKKWFYR